MCCLPEQTLNSTSFFASVPTGLWYKGRSVVSGGVLAEVRDLRQGTFVSV